MNKILLFIYFFAFTLVAKSQTADFTFQSSNGLYCNPTTIQFSQRSSGNPEGFVWNFGNGQLSNEANPVITFATPGNYTVKLIAIYAQNTAQITKTITINPSITASVGYDRNYICKPGVINFTASSSANNPTYTWNFGDNSSLINSTSGSIAHNYLSFGDYSITVKATDASGCFATASTSISVKKPPVSATLDPTSGCVPQNVTFTGSVVTPVNGYVSNYSWNFRDGSAVVSTVANSTSHIYTAAGGYAPVLTITTNEGCTNSFKLDSIAYGTPPTNHIAYPIKTTICGSETAMFFSKATKANLYYWDFGDNRNSAVTDTFTKHRYFTLGIKNIKVTPYYNGCPGKPISFQINVAGVIASYDYINTCQDKKTFSFTNTSQGNVSSLSWDFGDGTPGVNTVDAIHTFPASGIFPTKLFVSDNQTGCSDSYAPLIYTANPSLVNQDSFACRNINSTFTISNNYGNPSAVYLWDVLGTRAGSGTTPSITVKQGVWGFYNNSVIIDNGKEYCRDTIGMSNPFPVTGPMLSFTSTDSVCFKSSYAVTNTSKPFIPADSIKIWNWDFGEGKAIDNNFQPQPYIFTNSQDHIVKLLGIDIKGCKDSITKTVTIKPIPFLKAIPGVDTLCFGETDSLIAFSTFNDKILWSPANFLSCATCDTVIANPPVTTKFFVTANNAFNCITTDSVLVKVYLPFVATALISDFYICPTENVKLEVDPPMKKILWSPSTGLSKVNGYGPIAAPSQTTRYIATLTDSAGCFTSSTDINVHVKSLPIVNAGPDKVYPYNSTFTLNPVYSNNVREYYWSPSTLLSCRNCAAPSGLATFTTTYYLKVTSDSGCVAKDTVKIFVECKDANILMPNAFTPNGDNINDKFFPLTRGVRYILRFSIYNRQGKLVYEAKNFLPNNRAFGWDGKIINRDQSSSVFVYYIEAYCDTGEKLSSRGSFVLIR